MIPKLEIDIEAIKNNWDTEEQQQDAINIIKSTSISGKEGEIEAYLCDECWVKIGVFKQFKNVVKSLVEYGYCDNEESLIKYLKPYIDSEKNYFIHVDLLSMDYEKYYKSGSYINKDGIDTGFDYYDWIDMHPEDEIPQQIENHWISFTINEIA